MDSEDFFFGFVVIIILAAIIGLCIWLSSE